MSALVFLYEQVLQIPVGSIAGLVAARKPRRLPSVLTRTEVRTLLAAIADEPFALLAGLLYGKLLLGVVFDSVFNLTDEGWRKLTWRWIWFFFALAVLNEIVWRTQTTDFWVNFKVFAILPITLVFGALQYPLLMKYSAEKKN